MLFEDKRKGNLTSLQKKLIGVVGGVVLFVIIFMIIPAIIGGGPRLTMEPSSRARRIREEQDALGYVKRLESKLKTVESSIEKKQKSLNEASKALLEIQLDLEEFQKNCIEKYVELTTCINSIQRYQATKNFIIQEAAEILL